MPRIRLDQWLLPTASRAANSFRLLQRLLGVHPGATLEGVTKSGDHARSRTRS